MSRFTFLAACAAVLCLGQLALAAPAQKAAGQTHPAMSELQQIAQQLNLTADEKSKAKEIFKSTHQQVLAVLTPDQQTALKASKGQTVEDRLKALNLSDDQKAKIKSIRQQGLASFRAILTTDQQTKLDQIIAAKKQARQGQASGARQRKQ